MVGGLSLIARVKKADNQCCSWCSLSHSEVNVHIQSIKLHFKFHWLLTGSPVTTMKLQQPPYRKITKVRGEKYHPFESTQAKQDWQTFIFSKTVELLEATKMPWRWFELLLQRLASPVCSLMPGSQHQFSSQIFWLCKLHRVAEHSGWALPGHGVKPRHWTVAGKDGITWVPCSQQRL